MPELVTTPLTPSQKVIELLDSFTKTEKRIANIILQDPESFFSATVAKMAELANTSGPSIVRFAHTLGYGGFLDLQAALKDELSEIVRPAASRIAQNNFHDSIDRVVEIEAHNIRATLEKVDREILPQVVDLLADYQRKIYILCSDQCLSAGVYFNSYFSLIRDNIVFLNGSDFRCATYLSTARAQCDVIVTLDLKRHEQWLINSHLFAARNKDVITIILTDDTESTLVDHSDYFFKVYAASPSLFSSMMGMQALLNVFITEVAVKLKNTVNQRLCDIDDALINSAAMVK